MARNLDELIDKYFDPIINADSYDDIRSFVRGQDPDEVDQFLQFYGWRHYEDRRIIVQQELDRLRTARTSFAETIDAKPGVFGITVDVKKLWHWASRRLQKEARKPI